MNSEAHEAPDLRDYLRLVWRRGWIMVLCVVLIPLAAYEYTKSQPKVFQSKTILQVASPADPSSILGSGGGSSGTSNLDLVAALVSTSSVSNEAARELGMPAGSLAGAAQASADSDTGLLTITATGSSAQRSQQVATAFANALTLTRQQEGTKRVNQAIQTVQQQLKQTAKTDLVTRGELQSQLQRLQALRQAQTQNAQVVEPAKPGAQTAPHPRRNATAALILAIFIGAGLIALSERMDRKLRKPEDIEKLTNQPFLATIPHEAFPGEETTAEVHEAFQTLRSSLTYFNADQQLHTLLVVSPLKGEGKTTVATNLAAAYASSGKRVILVDTDLRKPDAAERMEVDQPVGLSQVLAGNAALHDAMREVKPFGNGLRVVPAGAVPPNASALLGSLRMASLIEELEADADLVIMDTTPLLAVSDAFPLLDKASGIVALVRLDKTPRDAIRRMLQVVESAGGNVLGIVATDGKRRISGGYGYGYGYGGYGYGRQSGRKSKRAPDEAPAAAPAPVSDSAPAVNGGSPAHAPEELQET